MRFPLLLMLVLVPTGCNTIYQAHLAKTTEPPATRPMLEGCLAQQGLKQIPIEHYLSDDQPREGDARVRYLGEYFQASVWEEPESWIVVFHPWHGGANAAREATVRFQSCLHATLPDIELVISSERFLDLR